jgi:pyruvate ferredoxin oxidoreductase alpha subunit
MSGKRTLLSGNEATAIAMRQATPDVFAAFPITPSTEVPQYFSKFVADGQTDAVFVPVESEHSSMSACIGASGAGARTFTATSANGLALMWEELYIAASMRLPVVMACVNRALSGPININNDHSDSMGARDSGWLQLYSENAQEAYDQLFIALKTAEAVNLPAMVCQDGFITSHAVDTVELIEDEDASRYCGIWQASRSLLGASGPVSMGPYDGPEFYMEHKRQQAEAMVSAFAAHGKAVDEYRLLTGRNLAPLESYRLDDAEYAFVLVGSSAGTGKDAVDRLREKGEKVGLLKIRLFRPFPAEGFVQALAGKATVAVMDKCDGFSGSGGPLAAELAAALYSLPEALRPELRPFVYGLGGRDVRVEDFFGIYESMKKTVQPNAGRVEYRGVREEAIV